MPVDRYTQIGDLPDYMVRQIVSSMPDYNLQLSSLQAAVDEIRKKVVEAMEMSLRTVAIDVLRDENAKLVAALSRLTLDNKRLRGYLGDIVHACISCKKQAYQPHKDGCEWQPSFPALPDPEE